MAPDFSSGGRHEDDTVGCQHPFEARGDVVACIFVYVCVFFKRGGGLSGVVLTGLSFITFH